jgi:transketolase C-terminal domain/subunit
MRRKFSDWAKLKLKSDSALIVLLGDISVGLFVDANEQLPERCFNVGVLEQSMMSFGAGMSRSGFKVLIHTISPFMIERTLEQIKLDVGYNKNKVILVSANSPFEYSRLGPTHHCSSDIPLLVQLGYPFDIRLPIRTDDVVSHLEFVYSSKETSAYIRLHSFNEKDIEVSFSATNTIIASSSNTETSPLDSISVIVGEAVYLDNAKALADSTSHKVIIDHLPLDPLLAAAIARFPYIYTLEPYSVPLLAHGLSRLTDKNKIIPSCYSTVSEGIFSSPPIDRW